MLSRLRHPARRLARDEKGGALVIFVAFLPVLIAFVMLAVDVGNWFQDHRQLQLAADAGALAGGTEFFFPCSDAPIEAVARQYAGDPAVSPRYNVRVPPPADENLHVLINSTDFWNEGGSDYSDGMPCAKSYIDVKLTDSNVPWYFRVANVSAINARARVSIQQAAAVSGSLPIGVRDPNVNSAVVLFIDDSSKIVLDAEVLVKQPGGSPAGNAIWSNAATPADVSIAPHTTAVIALSSLQPGSLVPPSPGASANAWCAAAAAECLETDPTPGSTDVRTGIVYMRGFSMDGTATLLSPPLVRSVWLAPGPSASQCNNLGVDSYFSWYQSKKKGTCTVGLRAVIDIGGRPANNVQVRVTGGGCGPCTVQRPGTGGIPEWHENISIETESGANPISLDWEVTNGQMQDGATIVNCVNSGTNPPACKGSFGKVQQYFAGSDDSSGPVRVARVWDYTNYDGSDPSTIVGGVNSFRNFQNRRLVAEVHLGGSIAQAVTDPPIAFRVVGRNLTGSIDCDPDAPTLREEMTKGCKPLYEKNTQLSQADPCNPPYTNKNDLLNSAQPWDCVIVATGGTVGQFTDGILGRIFNGGTICTGGGCSTTCPTDANGFVPGRNYWDPTGTDNLYKGVGFGVGWNRNDPRIIGVFMVPFGSFRVSSDRLYPVINFGTFYVTGWTGNGGADDPCPGRDQPTGAARARTSGGIIYGHFINYSLQSNVGGGSGVCDLSQFTPCVAVLTE